MSSVSPSHEWLGDRAKHLEVDSDIRQTIEARLPGNMHIPFDAMKGVFSMAVREVNKENKA